VSTAIAISVFAGFGCKNEPLCTAAVDKSGRLDYKRFALFFRARATRNCTRLFKCAVGLAVQLVQLRADALGFCG
jgi:hypothetical protein